MAKNEPGGRTVNLGDLLTTIFRHKKKVVLIPIASMLLGLLVILFMPRTYRSVAKLYLQVGRETVGMDPTATLGQTISLQRNGRNEEVKSALEVLRSRGVIAKVVDHLGPAVVLGRGSGEGQQGSSITSVVGNVIGGAVGLVKSLDPVSDREKAIICIERKLHAEAQRDSTVMVLTYLTKSPELAQTVCSAVVRIYREEHLRIHRNKQSRPFFEKQRNRLQKELDAALAELRNAKNEMGLSNVIERRTTLEGQYKEIELAKYVTQQEFANSAARVGELDRQLGALPMRLTAEKTSIPNEGADLLREKLYTLQMKSMELRARYSDSHPLVQAIADQVQEAEKIVSSQSAERFETTDNLNPVHQELEFELKQQRSMTAGQEARLARLEEQKRTILADLRAVNGYEVRVDQLERDVQIARTSFFRYADNYEQARVDKDLETEKVSNLSVVQAATLQEKPASPNKLFVLMSSLLLATAGTALVVLISELMNSNLRTEEDIENALGLPVLASIPDQRRYHRVLRSRSNGRSRGAKASGST